MIILAFRLIEVSVWHGDYGGRANQGRKLGAEVVYAKTGRVWWPCLTFIRKSWWGSHRVS